MGIADMQALGRWRGLGRVAVKPLVHIEIVELLGPQQAGQGLALHIAGVVIDDALLQGGVEVIGLLATLFKQFARVDLGRIHGRKAQVKAFALQARQFKDKARGNLSTGVATNRSIQPFDHVIVDPILERPRRRLPVEQREVAFVFTEQPFQAFLAPGAEMPIGQFMMTGQHVFALQPQLRLARINGPAPVIARPHLRQHLQARRLLRTVVHGDAHENIVGLVLGVFDADVAVAVVFEHAGIKDLVLGIVQPTPGVFGEQVGVGKGGMGGFVEHAHVGMAGHAVDEKVQLLDVFTVVALGVIQAEQALLEDRVALVPQGQAQAPALCLVAETGQAILAPPIGAAARMFMGEVSPGIAVGAVVFAHRAPLAFAQIGAPLAPTLGILRRQALAFNRVQYSGVGCGRHRVLHRLPGEEQCRAQ